MKKKHEISILEMGASVPGEIETLCLLAKPTHGIITNVAPAHLEGFGSIETIAYEKGALFRSLDKGISFVNKADKLVSKIQFSGKRITYGLSPDCDFPVDICHEDDGSLTLVIDSNVIPTSSHNHVPSNPIITPDSYQHRPKLTPKLFRIHASTSPKS